MIHDAAGDARKIAAEATSSGVPIRLIRVWLAKVSRSFGSFSSKYLPSASVSIGPGKIALTLMPRPKVSSHRECEL